MDEALLSVHHLQITFTQPKQETIIAVNQLLFSLKKGKVLAIVGESGSGKSLTALALMGLLPTTASVKGTIHFHTRTRHYTYPSDQNSPADYRFRGKEMSMVFQEPMSALNPVMTIGKQLQETLLLHQSITAKEAKVLAIQWLQKVQIPQPENAYHKYPHEMSGGQKQRVMIAMAMCNEPDLLICDEPTTALDVTVQQEIIKLMQQLQQQFQSGMIFITHDLALAASIADEVMVLYKGEMVELGSVAQVIHQPQHPYTKALLACKPTAKDKGSFLPTVSDFLQATQLPEVKQHPSLPHSDKVLLQVKDLQISFVQERNWWGKPTSYYPAVQKVSFELKQGEVLGLVGESGCGKSTLSRAIMGLQAVQSGSIFFHQQDIAHLSPQERKKLSTEIQLIFQDPYASLNPRRSIGELLMEPMQVHHTVPTNALKTEALRLLSLVQLPPDSFYRYPHQFSGGQRQRIGIARALSVRPKLLICDESVSALDVSVQAQILNLLKDLQSSLGLTYLFISHDLSVVQYISDRVLVMQQGVMVEQGDATEILQSPQQAYTQKLVAAIPKMPSSLQ